MKEEKRTRVCTIRWLKGVYTHREKDSRLSHNYILFSEYEKKTPRCRAEDLRDVAAGLDVEDWTGVTGARRRFQFLAARSRPDQGESPLPRENPLFFSPFQAPMRAATLETRVTPLSLSVRLLD